MNTESKISGRLRQIFFAVFVALFSLLFFGVIFTNPYFDFKPWLVLPLAAVWGGLFYGMARGLHAKKEWLAAHEGRALLLFFVLLSLTQIVFYLLAAGYPTRDFERVFTGAYNYTITGEILDPYLDYFYKYPNNLPLTVVYQFLFRIFHRFGWSNFFLLGALFNAACIDLAYLFTYLSVRRLKNPAEGFLAMGLLYLCLPVQSYISIFYTDTTTMLYGPALFYLFLRLRGAASLRARIGWYAAFGLVAGFGMTLKYSVVITAIAILVDLVLRADWKRAACTVLAVVLGFSAVGFGMNSFIYNHILDESKAGDMATPFIAWIAMGLQSDGTHSPDDNHYIWSHETHEEKVDAATALLKARLAEHGFPGYLGFLYRKGIRSFGSGNMDYPNTVADSPMHETFMTELLHAEGRWHTPFAYLVQGYHIALFTLILLAAGMALRRRDNTFFVPFLSIFGLYLFLLLWEAGTRYLLNYMPLFALCAAVALMERPAKEKAIE